MLGLVGEAYQVIPVEEFMRGLLAETKQLVVR
jgi:hypothetical protein